MKLRFLLTALPFIAACTVDDTPARGAEDQAVEKAAVERTITDWFNSTVATADTAALKSGLTKDFLLLEDTVWYDGDGFAKMVAELPGKMGVPFTARYTLSDWHTTVHGDVAWSTFSNSVKVTAEGRPPMEMRWLETAILTKKNGRWLLAQYQSAVRH